MTAVHLDPDDRAILGGRARQIVERHDSAGPEADIRAAVRSFLQMTNLVAPRDLEAEASPGAGAGRVDLKTPDLLIEFKRRIGSAGGLQPNPAYVEQLDGYLRTSQETGQPQRMGVLTDGKHWLLRWPGAGPVRTQKPFAFTFTDPDEWPALHDWLRDESQAFGGRQEIAPSEDNVRRRLGPGPRFDRDIAALKQLYDAHRDNATIRVKRQLWRSLLAAALGVAVEEQADLDELFLRHTYLSVVVGLAVQSGVWHPDRRAGGARRRCAALGARLRRGHWRWWRRGVRLLRWPAEVGGDAWLRAITRRIARFEWASAEYDVARILYEAVIPTDDRRRLGEYYTPDWLAREIVDTVVTDPLNQRVLDPACGSGTFIFAAVRKISRGRAFATPHAGGHA